MAESIGSLFLRIGINLSELQSDFISAEKTVAENMARLSRESRIIKLRAEMEIAGLDPAKNAAKILETQMQSLTQQIENQQERIKLTTAAWLDAKNKFGEAAAQTQKLNVKVEEENAALARLQQQLRNLNNQKITLGAEQLNAQFTNMQRTIDTFVSNLNQKNNIIRLRTEFETSGLDKAKDATKILEIQTKSLNQQIKNQQAILRATEKALNETTARKGKFNSETLKAAASVEREKLALKRLEEELRNVANEQKQLNDQQNSQSKNSLLNGYNNIKGNISGKLNEISTAFNGISAASQSADGAITKSLEIIGTIPTTAGKAAAALASLPLVLRGVENSILNYTKAATASGDSVYVMSRGMQLSVAEMGKLSTVAKVTGIDINEVNANLRRMETQAVKSGDSNNAMTKTLEKYNVKLTDANGNLKKGIELSLALADGLKKAQAEGKGAEFISAIGGKFWSGDFITYLEDLKDNIDAAGKIVKNGLANPALAHQVQGNLNAMDAQAAQLKASFASAFIPVANEIVPRITERMGELTKFIADNKDEIKAFGNAVAGFFGKIEDGADMAFKAVKILHDGLKALKDLSPSEEAKELERSYSSILNPNFDNAKKIMDSYQLANPTYFAPMLKTLDDVKVQTKDKVESINEELEKLGSPSDFEIELAKKIAEKNKALREKLVQEGKLPSVLPYNENNKDLGFAGASSIAGEREDEQQFAKRLEIAREYVNKYRTLSDELYKITHDEYENKKMDLLNWRQELLNNEETTAEQRILIEKIYAEKSKQIEQDRQQKINDIREEIAAANRTDLENQIAQIEATKERRIQAGLPVIEAEKAAEQEKYKAIKQLEEEFAEARDAIYQTELEKRFAQIEKEKQAWIQKGIDEVKATELAEQQKAEAARNAAMNVLKSQLKDYRAFRDGGYEALQQRMLAQLRKAGISDLDLQINPQQLQDFLSAQKNIQDNFLPNFKDFNESINNNLNEMAENVKNVNPSLDEAKTNLSEITEPLAEFKTNLSDMAAPVEDIKESFSAISESVIELPDLFNSLSESVLSLIDTIETLPDINLQNESSSESSGGEKSPTPTTPNIDTSALQTMIDSVNTTISEARNSITQLNLTGLIDATNQAVSSINDTQGYIDKITSQMNEATSQLSQMMSTVSATKDSLSEVKDALDKVAEIKVSTPTVNITQNIDEPHAWNDALIQELADKVADKMKNEIIYAIKNSYSY